MTPTTKRSVPWVVWWVSLGLGVGVWIAITQPPTAAAEYFAAYLLELSLSVDNIFVFLIVFAELHFPPTISVECWGGASSAHLCSGP